ncbi:outer membrane protein assembly factor BamB [Pseudidiomarina insulisalsae]|uniref:Outer membrane protein assembly factor BamB n=1 Tax=Pseudidiomarina insulisalsae TaxID=575789 RepID=A0A432YNP9_9GAMM|nr:outer membrane protein assembly factor BamB [Pseudidiomarina insulisalsae]RUO62576.1 outer membrane protein assembly factor BamB [Pseudidiomarina insulisalsae]
MKQLKYLQRGLLVAVALGLSGCSIFSDEEITYKQLQPFNAGVTPSVAWEASAGDGVGEFFSRLNPTVVDQHIVVADREGMVIGYQRDTGKRVWARDLQAEFAAQGEGWLSGAESLRISGGLVSYRDKVVLGTENGDVIMLNGNDGSVIWHNNVKAEILSDPAVDASYVVVTASNGKVFGLNAETGEQLWSMVTDVPALSLRGTSAPLIAAGGAIFGTANGKLTVAVLNNGQQVWEARLAMPSGATELQRLVDVDTAPVMRGELIYNIAYNGQLAAVEMRTGRVVWQREYSSYQNLEIYGRTIFATDSDDRVYAIDIEGGIEEWINNDFEGRGLTAPVYFNGHIVVGDSFGYLHFIDAQSGEVSGRLEVDSDVYVAPVVADDTLYVQTRDGSLLAVRIN